MIVILIVGRYKDGRIIPLEDWDDVDVVMTREDKQVLSVLKIKNLSPHKSVVLLLLRSVNMINIQTRHLHLQT